MQRKCIINLINIIKMAKRKYEGGTVNFEEESNGNKDHKYNT